MQESPMTTRIWRFSRFLQRALISLAILWCAPLFAEAKTLRIECLGLTIQHEGSEGLFIGFDGDPELHLIDRSDPSQANQELAAIATKLARTASTRKLPEPSLTTAVNHQKFSLIIESIRDDVFGRNSLDPQEQEELRRLQDRIQTLNRQSEESLSERAKQIKKNDRKMSLEEARATARSEPDFIWLDYELQSAKLDVIHFLEPKAEPLGIHFSSSIENLEKAVRKADPFRHFNPKVSKFKRVPFERGKELLGKWGQSNLEEHFEKHKGEFPAPIKDIDDYKQRAIALLRSKDLNTISYVGIGKDNGKQPGRIYKLNTITNEVAIFSPNGAIISYFPLWEKFPDYHLEHPKNKGWTIMMRFFNLDSDALLTPPQ